MASPPPRTEIPTLAALDPFIRTPRLLLRPLAESDVDALWPYVSDPELPRMMSWSAHTERDQTLAFVRHKLEVRAQGTAMGWAIEHEGAARGLIALDEITWAFRAWRVDRAELGYWLAPPLWGRGLMTEAAGAATRFGFETLGLHKITVGCVEENVGSRRVIEKVGFRFLARHVDDFWRDGRWWSHLRYELTRAAWGAR